MLTTSRLRVAAAAFALSGLLAGATGSISTVEAQPPGLCNYPPSIYINCTYFRLWSPMATVHTSSKATLKLQIGLAGELDSTNPSALIVALTTGKYSPDLLYTIEKGPNSGGLPCWDCQVGPNPFNYQTPASLGETHDWIFPLPSIFATTAAIFGPVSVSTGTSLGPFGSVSLRFSPQSAKDDLCLYDSPPPLGVLYSGSLTANVNFHTFSKAWGTVHPTKAIKFAPGSVATTSYPLPFSCNAAVPPGLPMSPSLQNQPCNSGFLWGSTVNATGDNTSLIAGDDFLEGQWFAGTSIRAGGVGFIRPYNVFSGVDSALLSKPAGALRVDALVAVGGTATYDKTAGTLSLSGPAASGPGFSGTAMVTAPVTPAYGSSRIFGCVVPTGIGDQAYSGLKPATWSDGGSPLKTRFAVGPSFTVPAGSAPDMDSFSYTVTHVTK